MDYFTILKALSTLLIVVLIFSFLLFLFMFIDWGSFAIIMVVSGVFSFLILPKLARIEIKRN